jgi:hypothetical protein
VLFLGHVEAHGDVVYLYHIHQTRPLSNMQHELVLLAAEHNQPER